MHTVCSTIFRQTLLWIFATVLFAQFHLATAQEAHNSPIRIASTHLCTDQLLTLVAKPERILTLSHFAGDPDMSMIADSAKNYPTNRGLAEELIVLQPDLILTSQFGSPNVLLLRRLGYQIVNVPFALSIDDIRKNIRIVANAIGEPERGEQVIKEFDRRMSSPDDTNVQSKPKIIMYQPNGYTSGSHTLRSEVIEHAGFSNLAVELGMSHTQHLPLELLIAHNLDALMIDTNFDHPALAHELPNHPAIRAKFQDLPQIRIPGKMWICGTPFVTEALDQLVEFRKQRVEQNS